MEAAPSAFVARLHVPGLNATRLLHRPKVAPEPQSPHLETPLVAAKSSRRIAEPASDMVLTGVPGFEKRSHGVGFRGAILGGVTGKDYAMNQDRSVVALGLDTNVRVRHGATRQGRRSGQKLWLPRRRLHGG